VASPAKSRSKALYWARLLALLAGFSLALLRLLLGLA
jgi:hypothetical protein